MSRMQSFEPRRWNTHVFITNMLFGIYRSGRPFTASNSTGATRLQPWRSVRRGIGLGGVSALRMRIAIFIALASALLVGCRSQHYVTITGNDPDAIYDFTTNRSATCEVHGITMSPQVVSLEFGMKMPTDTSKARCQLFPHADEPYDTGFCIPLVERRGRVFVCSRCTAARTT